MFAITPRAAWVALLGAGCSGEAPGPESPASPALSPSAGRDGGIVIALPAPPEAASHRARAVAPLAPRPEAVPQMSVDPPGDVADPPADAGRTRSGVAFKVLKKGQGTRHPAATDRVVVHSSGWTADGRLFDSSLPHGKPFVFDLRPSRCRRPPPTRAAPIPHPKSLFPSPAFVPSLRNSPLVPARSSKLQNRSSAFGKSWFEPPRWWPRIAPRMGHVRDARLRVNRSVAA